MRKVCSLKKRMSASHSGFRFQSGCTSRWDLENCAWLGCPCGGLVIQGLVYRLANNDDVAGGQLAVFQRAFNARAKRPYLSHTGRASNAEKQPTGPGPEGCVENRPAAALLVGHVSIQICALSASPARTALPAAHFERNDVTIIYETVHQALMQGLRALNARSNLQKRHRRDPLSDRHRD
jgi:hypothetical protein